MIKIIQQNIDSYNHRKDSALEYQRHYTTLMDQLLEDPKPDILMLTEFCYARQIDTIVKRLEKLGYEIILPKAFEDMDKTKTSMYASCMMAVQSDGFSFSHNPDLRNPISPISCRFIEGTLTCKRLQKNIELFQTYVPQTSISNEEPSYSLEDLEKKLAYLRERMELKAAMLVGAYKFWQENKGKPAFLGGDFNTAMDESTSMESLFKMLYEEAFDSDRDRDKPTWNDKRLDYALVSKDLKNCCETTHLETVSDHSALVTILDLK